MKRVTVQLKDLNPNPYKKQIQGGFIDPVVVEQIRESAEKTSFWEQWVVRETGKGQYELAFGHHRLEAAKQLYGSSYEVSVQVEEYTDEQMLIAMADENAGSAESVEAQADVVRISREYLKAHPEACKTIFDVQCVENENPAKGRPHEHGSEKCIAAFLGETNWSHDKVGRLVAIADKLDAALLEDVVSETHPERTAAIGITSAVEIAKLDKPAQAVVVKAIKEAHKDLKTFQKTELQERTKKDLPRSAVKDMSTHIPAAIVREAVKKAVDLPPAQQATAAVQHIKQKVQQRKEYAIAASLPESEQVVARMVSQLFNFPANREMQELIGNREYLSSLSKNGLLTALNRTIERLTKYRDTLASAPQQKLTGLNQPPVDSDRIDTSVTASI